MFFVVRFFGFSCVLVCFLRKARFLCLLKCCILIFLIVCNTEKKTYLFAVGEEDLANHKKQSLPAAGQGSVRGLWALSKGERAASALLPGPLSKHASA